jgi:predicted RNA-binding Zn-ribbon protein involved in translation (DUF1610 family)
MSAVHQLKIQKKPYLDLLSGIKTGEVRDCSDRDFQVGDSVWLTLVDETGNPTGQSASRMITHIQRGYGLPDEVCVLSYAPQPQPAAHLTIPGALEWDGDNGTHGADGESRSHGESLANHSGDTNEKAEPAEEFPNCDYCGIIPDYHPWHGSGVINGTESPHIHACNECRHKLPAPISAYTAVDMTTAAADGFRDGQASANDSLKAFANEMIGAAFEGGSFDGGDIQAFGVKHGLLQVEQRAEECGEVCACREYGFPAECYRKTDLLKPAAPAKCESCGGWGHIETEDSAHDCPECGPSVVERAVEAGVMNAPDRVCKGSAILGNGCGDCKNCHEEMRNLKPPSAMAAKAKTCIECDQPYCHGVCVERGDQDYGRDQAAKGGDDE